jgi:uncharacterized protein YdeI (YjbR/CyaY-like superfamily)
VTTKKKPATKQAGPKPTAPKKTESSASTPLRAKPARGKATAMDNDPVFFFADSAAFEAWLSKNHDVSKGAWLQHVKKGATRSSVSYQEALDVCLCWGWIDGQKRAHDDETFLQRYSPRGKKSIWSTINRDKVAALEQSGRMRPQGRAHVDAAKQDGRWENAYGSQSTITVPADLQAALDENPAALQFFLGLKGANRYAILHRTVTAVKPETRAARIAKFVAMCARGETLH